jgi:hypothetical protein
MLKISIAALLACCSLPALSQTPQLAPDLDLRKAECPKIAKAAGYAYYAKKEEGKTLAITDTFRATGLTPIYQWSIDYATSQASGPDDAVHMAIEKCLRNVEIVKAASARGESYPIADLK